MEILEFANSQLLEFRYYDRLLDEELERIYAQHVVRTSLYTRGAAGALTFH